MAPTKEVELVPGLRLRWMVVGAAVGYVSKRKAERSIEEATSRLERRLPTPVANAARLLPGEVTRVGGAVVVAGNGAVGVARNSVVVARHSGRVASRTLRMTRAAGQAGGRGVVVAQTTRRRIETNLRRAFDDVGDEIERERRRLRSEQLRETEGEAAALEALLDLRRIDEEPLPEVPAPIRRGRRRARPALSPPPVARVQRSYHPPVNPWDRPSHSR